MSPMVTSGLLVHPYYMGHSVLFQRLFVDVLSWTMGDDATSYLIGQCRD